MARNYRQEYDRYQGTATQKKRRASRNKARRLMVAKGKAKKGDGKDVAHKDNNPLNSVAKNMRMESKKSNRSFKRTKNASRA
tara:strand:- start:854 stop:1099 length:246 start_codon:yes stop_codon:yes gene_type:complete